ncbi:MAG: transporter ATP-binding protein [Acidobacteria bacterium]|nr:transporter ATP-binding protein [Acidobacteriota bacterium]
MTAGSAAPNAQPGLHVRGLRKSFRVRGREQQVLRGVDLEIRPGEVIGLIGPNGAGKTTLMSCLLGFLGPDDGEVRFDGRANDDLGIRARTGFVPERMNFGRRSSGRGFLRYMAGLAGLRGESAAARVEELLARLDLMSAAEKKLSQYSRGMLQRIGMCQALLARPDFLFLDEPTSGLDPNGVMQVRDVIAEERGRGALVLLNSHQLAEVERVCDRVLFLSQGVITQHETLRSDRNFTIAITLLPGSYDTGTVTALAGAPQGDTVMVSVADETAIAELVRRLVGSGAGVIDVRRHTADLEHLFRSGA